MNRYSLIPITFEKVKLRSVKRFVTVKPNLKIKIPLVYDKLFGFLANKKKQIHVTIKDRMNRKKIRIRLF